MIAPQALALLMAVLVLGTIPLVLVAWLGRLRVPAIMRGEIAIKDIALDRSAWPDQARKVSNALDNQFQLPIIFYLTGMMMMLLGMGWLEILLAWIFVISRVVHVTIHVTTNNVIHRFFAYATGYAVLVLLWLSMIVRWLMVAF